MVKGKESGSRRRQRGEGGLYQRCEKQYGCPPAVRVIDENGKKQWERPDHDCRGLWVGVVDLPTAGTGKRRRRKLVYGKTMKAAQKKLNDEKRKLHSDGDLSTSDLSLEKWLTYWLREIVYPRADPETYKRYRANCRLHIIPEIGGTKLGRLQPKHVRDLQSRFTRLELSESTAASAHRTLVTALNDAMKERGLGRNVAQLVDAPRIGTADEVALTMDEVRRFMRVAERYPRTVSRWLAAFLVGTRQGETLGLRWSAVDWENQTMDIAWQLQRLAYRHGCGDSPMCGRKRASDCPDAVLDAPRGFDCDQLYGRLCLTRPKSSRHLIPIPKPLLLALQLRHEQAQSERDGYVTDHDLVWCRPDGEPIDHEGDYDEWVDWLSAAGIPHVKLHAARHTTATLLRALGYSADVIRMILGHSSVLMTQGYTEMDVRLAREALAGYGDALGLPSGKSARGGD